MRRTNGPETELVLRNAVLRTSAAALIAGLSIVGCAEPQDADTCEPQVTAKDLDALAGPLPAATFTASEFETSWCGHAGDFSLCYLDRVASLTVDNIDGGRDLAQLCVHANADNGSIRLIVWKYFAEGLPPLPVFAQTVTGSETTGGKCFFDIAPYTVTVSSVTGPYHLAIHGERF